jgi:hypothetical protein
MIERRLESRFLCADLVKVEWLARNPSGASNKSGASNNIRGQSDLHTVEALLEDISPLGACVQVEEQIPPGAAILISAAGGESAQLAGRVSYCVFRDYGYFVGVRFSVETPWSSRVFEPRHLTSLEELVTHEAH